MGSHSIRLYQLNLKNAVLQRDALALGGLMLIGLILRLWQINGALWYDEAFSAHLANLPISNLLISTIYDVHPPTYYLLLWSVTRLVGHTEFVLRLPSFVAGLALIPLVFSLARSLHLKPAAVWIAAGLVTLAPFQIYYSNEARFYALQTLFLTVAITGLFLQRRVWLVTGALAALYLHHISLIFVVSIFAGGLIYHKNWTKDYFNAGAVILLGWLPMAGLAIHQAGAIHNNYWIPPLSSPGRLISLLDDLIFFAPGNTFVFASGLATALGLVIIVTGIPHLLNQTGYQPLMLLIIWLLCLSLVTLFSLVWQPVLISRVLAPLAPLYYLLLAYCVSVTRRRVTFWLAVTAPAVLAILAAMFLGRLGHKPIDANYLALYGQFQPRDGVFHTSIGSYIPWAYYRPGVAQYVLQQPGNLDQALTSATMKAMAVPLGYFDEVACQRPRWWIIQYNNPTSSPAEMDYLNALTQRYQAQRIHLLRADLTVEAAVYLIIPKCDL